LPKMYTDNIQSCSW